MVASSRDVTVNDLLGVFKFHLENSNGNRMFYGGDFITVVDFDKTESDGNSKRYGLMLATVSNGQLYTSFIVLMVGNKIPSKETDQFANSLLNYKKSSYGNFRY
jgi:ABC-type phosphate transport system auxiliary subunit